MLLLIRKPNLRTIFSFKIFLKKQIDLVHETTLILSKTEYYFVFANSVRFHTLSQKKSKKNDPSVFYHKILKIKQLRLNVKTTACRAF